MDIPKEKLTRIFVTESADIIIQLENDVLDLEQSPSNPGLINSIFRAFHTIKGNAGMLGLTSLKNFTHSVESLFLKVRKNKIKVNEDIITIIFKSIDVLKQYLKNINNEKAMDKSTINKILNMMDKYNIKKSSSNTNKILNPNLKEYQNNDSSIHLYYLNLEFDKTIFSKSGINPGLFIKDLTSICEDINIKLDISDLPELNKLDPTSFYLKWKILVSSYKDKSQIDDVFIFVIDDNKIEIKEITKNEYEKNLKYFKHGNTEDIVHLNNTTKEKELKINKENPVKKDNNDGLSDEQGTRKEKKESQELLKIRTGKVDKLMNLISELVISQARSSRLSNLILQSLYKLEIEASKYKDFDVKNIVDYTLFTQFEQTINTLDRILREMQNGVLEIRMVPVGPIFIQFKRMVRDHSKKVNKHIEFTIRGEKTELDKNMIKKINDPLVHLIRNAIDHGIETKEERIKKGKSPIGKLVLEAYQSEGKVVIAITDDGKGLDKAKIYNNAIKHGLIDLSEELTDHEIYQLIFTPGLSTATKITDVSGRGVGMDVVKNNIEALKGKIDISTKKGKGTIIKLILPLTLAIIDGMVVTIANKTYIIPILSIVFTYKASKADIKTVEGGKDEIIKFRDTYIPLLRLNEIFNFEYANPPKLSDCLIIAVEVNNAIIGLLVDKLIGKQQIVMKGLEENFENIRGISAATILGDGSVALILDIDSIVEISQEISIKKKQKRIRV